MIFALIIPALCLWGIYLFKTNVDLACKTATQCIISVMVGIVIDNVALKTLTYQWQCMSEVSHNKKISVWNKHKRISHIYYLIMFIEEIRECLKFPFSSFIYRGNKTMDDMNKK